MIKSDKFLTFFESETDLPCASHRGMTYLNLYAIHLPPHAEPPVYGPNIFLRPWPFLSGTFLREDSLYEIRSPLQPSAPYFFVAGRFPPVVSLNSSRANLQFFWLFFAYDPGS